MAASDITATERAEPVAWIEHHKGGDNLVSVSVVHWCDEAGPLRRIERVGKNKQDAIAAWNRRERAK
jgi:hypothetical protein